MARRVPAQQTSDVTDERRALVERAADLCRARPAVLAAVTRRADQLRAAGVERDVALSQALNEQEPAHTAW